MLQLSFVEICIALCLATANPACASVLTVQDIPDKLHHYIQGLEGNYTEELLLRAHVNETSRGAWSGAEISDAHRPDHFKSACYGPGVGVIVRARVSVSYLDWLVLSKASATSTG